MHARDRGGDIFYPYSMHTVSSWVTTELSLSSVASVASVASSEKQHPPFSLSSRLAVFRGVNGP